MKRVAVSSSFSSGSSSQAGPSNLHSPARIPLSHSLTPWLQLLLLLFLSLFIVTQSTSLPSPSTPTSPNTEFSESRARPVAADLVALGVRMVGMGSNEEIAPSVIRRRIRDIAQQAETHGVRIEVDEQVADGAFFMDFLGGLTMAYKGVRNILVRVSDGKLPLEEATRDALLIGSHYDSAVGSIGGMDAAAPIAIMVEVLRALVARSGGAGGSLAKAVIFNFNGGEEALMTGSHAFAALHPWAKTVRLQVNMDSSGAGGREVVFQSGPGHSWLMSLYAEVAPHPRGSVVGQDIFSSGVIPSDTDYRVYRDELGIPGYDLAFFLNGYVYHTLRDNMNTMDRGSLQHAGDNVLALAWALCGPRAALLGPAAARELGSAVYFDVLGLFMVAMDASTMRALTFALAAATCCVAAVNAARCRPEYAARGGFARVMAPAGAALVTTALAWLAGIAAPLALGAALDQVRPLSWFRRQWLAVGLFGSASAAAVLHVHFVRHQGRPGGQSLVQQALSVQWAAAVFWLALACLASLFGLGTAYVPFAWALAGLLALLLSRSQAFFPHRLVMHGSRRWWVLFLVATAVPLVMTLDLSSDLLSLFVPLTGRLGKVPADPIVGALVGLVTCAASTSLLPLFHKAGNMNRARDALAALCALLVVAALLQARYEPYKPKRLFFEHVVDRTVDPPRSGVVVTGFDRTGLGPVQAQLFDGEEVLPWEPALFFNYMFPFNTHLDHTGFAVVGAPPPPLPPAHLAGAWQGLTLTLNVTHSGSYAVCKVAADLTAWSWTSTLPPQHRGGAAGEQPFYHFRHTTGDPTGTSFTFSVTVRDRSKPVRIQLTATEQSASPATQRLLNKAPDWTTATSFMADMSAWVF